MISTYATMDVDGRDCDTDVDDMCVRGGRRRHRFGHEHEMSSVANKSVVATHVECDRLANVRV